MDELGYVETSDPEELEISRRMLDLPSEKAIRLIVQASSPDLAIPRKRRKFFHSASYKNSDTACDLTSSSRFGDKSITPVPSSSCPPTSTAVSDDEQLNPATLLSFKRSEAQENGGVGLAGLSQKVETFDDVFGHAQSSQSQDELDVISQPSTRASAASVDQISSLHTFDTSRGGTPPVGVEGQDPCGSLPSLSTLRKTTSVEGTFDRDEFNSNSLGRHVASRPKYSSLPPSSPPHASSSIINTPNRSVSYSPDLRVRSDNVGSNVPLGDSETGLHSPIEALDENAPRRYSLRTRQARQLNPYEYDKRLYKQQMKRLPDAMVKIVSPPRHGPGRTYMHRELEEDGDFVVPDDDNESQQARRRRSKTRKSSESPNEEGANNLDWLPPIFHMSDEEDLTPLSPLAHRDSYKPSTSDVFTRKHKVRQRPFKLPLEEARTRSAQSQQPGAEREVTDVNPPAITYRRRRDIRSSPKRAAERPNGDLSQRCNELSGHNSPSPEASSCVSRRANSGDGNDGPSACDHEEDRRIFDAEDYNAYNTIYDDDPDNIAHSSSRRDAGSNESSQSQSSDSPSDSEDKLTRKRKRLLGYLYPRSMINKGYFDKRPIPVRSRSRSNIEPATSEKEHGSEDEVSLAPGRSRITKRSNPSHADQEIKGDTDSSDSDTDLDAVKEARSDVISVESSDSESSTTSSLHGDDGDTLDPSIADTGYFDLDYSRQLGRRREEPLIDRMLSRTRGRKSLSGPKPRKNKSHISSVRRLAANGLDVSVLESSSQPCPRNHRTRERQTRLPFESVSVADRTGGDDFIDLTNSELEREGIQEQDDEVPPINDPKTLTRLTRKQRRDAVEKATLHTLNSGRKKIKSGRRKGYITVQIDLADAGFRSAIKPLHQHSAHQSQPAFSRTTSKGHIEKTPHHPRRLTYQIGNLKQTSLDDFAFDDALVADNLDYGEPMHRSANTSYAAEWQNEDRVRICSVDMGISMPTPGLAFGASTYLGKQLLPDLLNFAFKNAAPSRPEPYSGFDVINLDSEMSVNSFAEAVDITCNILFEWLDETPSESADRDSICRYEYLTHSISHFASWTYGKADSGEKKTLQTATASCIERLRQKVQETAGEEVANARIDARLLTVMWFLVELATRMLAVMRREGADGDISLWEAVVSLLVTALIENGIERTLAAIGKRDMSSMTMDLRTAELWVCIIHILSQANNYLGTSSDDSNIFWTILLQVVKSGRASAMSSIAMSEYLWKLIFGLSALSHFSPHGVATSEPRLVACWDIVGLALDTIRLAHNKEEDSKISRDSLKRRDKYLRMVVARCFILGTRWKWPLCDANVVFKKLVDIFRSRNFANLLGEGPEFPGFLRYQKITLLDELHHSDTAFGVYLKLVMQAAKATPDGSRNDPRVAKARLMKLLSLVVPLSGVPTSRERALTTEELPMLINRFSAIIIAILVDGRENANIQNRIDQARRFVNFADADFKSRQICIKAAMYMATVAGHLSLERKAPLQWLSEMCQTLLEEFYKSNHGPAKESDTSKSDNAQPPRHELVLLLHLLLGCVTNLMERPSLQADDLTSRYPDVDLISGPWVKRVFPMKELTNIVTTRAQILLLVQSFLNVRRKLFPSPRRQASSAATETDSESQDFFAEFPLDDEALASVPLGDGSEDNWAKDKEAAKIMNSDIIPHIFRLLLQYFNDPTARPSDESKLEEYWGRADDWIDCWVGCAAVVVRNGIRGWDHYLNVGPQSWAGIGDSFFRRRVAIRFMYQLLKCDPTAYSKVYERYFLSVLLQALVASKITMENEYSSTLFSVDGLRHPLLRELPLERASEQVKYRLSRGEFLEKRDGIISCIYNNLSSILQSDSSERDKNVLVECVLEMLSAMYNIHTNFSSVEDRGKYSELCRHVFLEIERHPRIHTLQRLSTLVAWGRSFTGPV